MFDFATWFEPEGDDWRARRESGLWSYASDEFHMPDFRKRVGDAERFPKAFDPMARAELPKSFVDFVADLALVRMLQPGGAAKTKEIYDEGKFPSMVGCDAVALALGAGTLRTTGLNLARNCYGEWLCCQENAIICVDYLSDDALQEIARRLGLTLKCLAKAILSLPLADQIVDPSYVNDCVEEHESDDVDDDDGEDPSAS